MLGLCVEVNGLSLQNCLVSEKISRKIHTSIGACNKTELVFDV